MTTATQQQPTGQMDKVTCLHKGGRRVYVAACLKNCSGAKTCKVLAAYKEPRML